MLVKAGQIIAIDSVKVDPTLSGDGVNSPLGVKAVAPTVSGHAGLSAEKNGNDVFLGLNNNAIKIKSSDGSVEIKGGVQPDGTFEYNIQVSAKPVVSDTKIYGGEGIKVVPEGSATYRVSVSGDYVKTERLNDYYTKDVADTTFQPKGDYVEETEIQDMATKTWVSGNFVENDILDSYYTKDEIYSKSETYSKTETYNKDEVYTKQEVVDLIPDISNFALSADVDTAIAENKETIKAWANDEFQKKGNYAEKTDIDSLSSTVDANFQKKGEYVTSADDSLAGKALVLKNNTWEEAPSGTIYTEGPNIDIHGTVISGRDWSPELDKVENDINGLNAAVAEEFYSTSAWANKTFQLSGDYLTDEDLLDYYNKSDVDDKVEELANEFDREIDSVSAIIVRDYALKTELEEKLDKSETMNWDVNEYSAGENITIQNHKISGKDWSTEIDTKQDKLSDKQLSAISSVSAIEAMSGRWVTSGVDVIAGNYYYGLVNNNGTVEWEPIPEPDYPDIIGNNGISAEFDDDNNEWNIGLSGKPVYIFDKYESVGTVTAGTVIEFVGQDYKQITATNGYFELPETAEKVTFNINENVENNNTGLHEYLLNKFALVTDSNEVLVYTQNYYPAEVGSSNGTIAITVDHSVAPTRKYAVVYSGSDVAASANLNFTMSIYSNRI